MNAIRIIAIVLALVATACGSSTDEATQISSSDAELATGYGDAAGASSGEEEGDVSRPEQTSDPADGGVEGGTGVTGGGNNDVDDSGSATDDGVADVDVDSVGTGFLARVSDATVEASTGRFEGRFAVEAAPGAEASGSFELSLAGAYDLEADALDLTVDLSDLAALAAADASAAEADMLVPMFAEPVQLRSIGSTVWFRWGLLSGMFGALTADGETAWIEAAVDEAASLTGQFGVDSPESPTDLLQALADLDATVTEIGRETVRGAETTHYRVVIDLEAAVAKLAADQLADLEAELPDGVSGMLPIDVWMDDNDVVRRLVIEIDDFESMGLGADTEGVASVLIEFELFDVGEPVTISPPPADQVITTDELGFSLDGGL